MSDNQNCEQKIAIIGLTCVDILSYCEKYPKEDDKIGTTTPHNRCLSQRRQRGGNASNTATVLGLLGAAPTLASTIARDPEEQFLLQDMTSYGINTKQIVFHADCSCPTSVVICSMATGSRTIVHSNQNLPELTLDDFAKFPLDTYTWVHFEGRNVDSVVKMQKLLKERAPQVTVSVELEKPRSNLELLMENADVIFASKDYAKFLGFGDMETAAKGILRKATSRCRAVIVPWGELGACCCAQDGSVCTSPAFPQDEVVESLGAGDSFLGAAIFALSRGKSSADSLAWGCRLAGMKVGVRGWDEFKRELPKILPYFQN